MDLSLACQSSGSMYMKYPQEYSHDDPHFWEGDQVVEVRRTYVLYYAQLFKPVGRLVERPQHVEGGVGPWQRPGSPPTRSACTRRLSRRPICDEQQARADLSTTGVWRNGTSSTPSSRKANGSRSPVRTR